MEDSKKVIIQKALKGNKQAFRFIEDLSYIARVWDNLVDGDKGSKVTQIDRAFWIALVEIPQNPFFQQYLFQLTPLIRDYINSWMDANRLEKADNEHNRRISFVLRDLIGNIVMQCAYLIGGYDWMREVSFSIRKFQFNEPYEKYLEELGDGTLRQ